MRMTALLLFIIAPIIAGSLWLQCFLARRKSKWLGLIIPLICFMFSLMTIFSISTYMHMETAAVTKTIDGTVINENTVTLPAEKPGVISMLAAITPVFIMTNIPTFIFLAVYSACREKLKLQTELDKMNIQDLE